MSQATIPATEDAVLTQPEAAKFLKVSVKYLYELSKTGRLKCVRMGRRAVRYRREDLVAFLAEMAKRPTTVPL